MGNLKQRFILTNQPVAGGADRLTQILTVLNGKIVNFSHLILETRFDLAINLNLGE